MQPQRVAIVGAAGFLGQHVLHQLLMQHRDSSLLTVKLIDKVTSLDAIKLMHPEDFHSDKVELHLGVDITQAGLHAVFENVEVVYHLAAAIAYGQKNADILDAVNVRGSENVVQAAQQALVRKIVYVSSFATIGCLDKTDKSELAHEHTPNDLHLEPYAHYARSKYLGEQCALNQASDTLQIIIAVPGILFGPGPSHHASVLPFTMAMNNKFMLLPQGGTNVIDVRDAADALVKLSESRFGTDKYLLMSHNLEHRELISKISQSLNRPIPLIQIPKFLASFMGVISSIIEPFLHKHSPFSKEGVVKGFKYRYFSNEKAKRELGWMPNYTIEETIRDTIAWIKNGVGANQGRTRSICPSNPAQNPVVITGANGFFGQHLTRELYDRGHEVYILTRDIPRSEKIFSGMNIKMIKGCLNQPESLQLPDNAHIFHCAGITGSVRVSEKEYYRVNVTGTENLLNAAIQFKAKSFNFVSSVSAVGAQGRASKPITENTQPNPKTYYGKSKLIAEKLLLAQTPATIPLTIIRPSLIYGPGQSDRSGAAMIMKLCQQKIIPKIGDTHSIMPMVHAKNLAAGFVDLSFKNSGKEIFNLTDAVPYTFPLMANTSARIIAVPYLFGAVFGYSADAIAWLTKRDIGLCSELIDNIAKSGSHMSIEKAKAWGYNPFCDML